MDDIVTALRMQVSARDRSFTFYFWQAFSTPVFQA
jgi:hypothetical protein